MHTRLCILVLETTEFNGYSGMQSVEFHLYMRGWVCAESSQFSILMQNDMS